MLKVHHWEYHLLDLAHQALEGQPGAQAGLAADRLALARAYRSCEAITRAGSQTFSMAARLLPEPKRRAIQALYAFCRVSDDIVDRPVVQDGQQTARQLDSWRRQVINDGPPSGAHPQERAVHLAWADARRAFDVPTGYASQLIDGLALDLGRARYQTFDDLARYCYGVACTVGLMSMHITGFTSRAAIPYAIRLGVALQLTNILRDVGEDWRSGRVYLPLEELNAFGLGEDGLRAGRVDRRWRDFMRFQIRRAHQLYEEALPGIGCLHPDGRFAIAAAGQLYRAILQQIEANDYDVFTRRAAVSKWGKIRRLPAIWRISRAARV